MITIEDGDTYFTTRLNADSWTEASEGDKLSALTMATQHIDRLNFIGQRNGQTLDIGTEDEPDILELPDEAYYEEALSLLDGRDIEKETDSLMFQRTSLGKISYDLNQNFVPEHVVNGIASGLAWQYLKPFLRDPRTVTFSRVN